MSPWVAVVVIIVVIGSRVSWFLDKWRGRR
jgi:hypothetical protein